MSKASTAYNQPSSYELYLHKYHLIPTTELDEYPRDLEEVQE